MKIRTKNIHDIDDLKRAHAGTGGYFFSKDTMKFFASRVLEGIYRVGDHILFCTSEKKCFDDATREYSIRTMGPSGSILPGKETYPTAYRAKTAAKKYAERGKLPCSFCQTDEWEEV